MTRVEDSSDWEKLNKLEKLKYMLHEMEEKLLSLAETFNWDFNKLLEKDESGTVTCSINSQHRVPKKKIKLHEESCRLLSQGYNKTDEIFSEYAGSGSCISLTPQLINSVTKNISSAVENKSLRPIPQTSANFDQNFSREEKLAIYDYVIANTKKQNAYSYSWKEIDEKKEEKKEMTVWEIAAAERDAKRRRASYRNKVHTHCKSHTQILREVIDGQMEMLKGEAASEGLKAECSKEKKNCHKNSDCRNKQDESRRKRENHDWRKNEGDKKWRRDRRGDSGSRSRSRDKHRKWKTSDGRSNFRK